MKVTYDRSVEAASITVGHDVRAGEAQFQREVPDTPNDSTIILDFDEGGHLLGVEVLGASAALRAHVL